MPPCRTFVDPHRSLPGRAAWALAAGPTSATLAAALAEAAALERRVAAMREAPNARPTGPSALTGVMMGWTPPAAAPKCRRGSGERTTSTGSIRDAAAGHHGRPRPRQEPVPGARR